MTAFALFLIAGILILSSLDLVEVLREIRDRLPKPDSTPETSTRG